MEKFGKKDAFFSVRFKKIHCVSDHLTPLQIPPYAIAILIQLFSFKRVVTIFAAPGQSSPRALVLKISWLSFEKNDRKPEIRYSEIIRKSAERILYASMQTYR